MRLSIVLVLVLCTGCTVLEYLSDAEEHLPNCDTRLPYYPDQDGDGVGADSPVYLGCAQPSGYVDQGGDCDDNDPDVIECPEPQDSDPPDDTGHTGDIDQRG